MDPVLNSTTAGGGCAAAARLALVSPPPGFLAAHGPPFPVRYALHKTRRLVPNLPLPTTTLAATRTVLAACWSFQHAVAAGLCTPPPGFTSLASCHNSRLLPATGYQLPAKYATPHQDTTE